MKLRRLREGYVLDDGGITLVRGGELEPDMIRADAMRYYGIYGSRTGEICGAELPGARQMAPARGQVRLPHARALRSRWAHLGQGRGLPSFPPLNCCGLGRAMERMQRRGRPWGADDLTGGPVDEVFARVRAALPGLVVERLRAMYPADDDNVYFLGDEHDVDRLQVDTGPKGRAPFLIEAEEQVETSDVTEAAAILCSWLGSGGA